MPAQPGSQFTVVGAGLAGTLMAVYLGRSGYEVELFEKRSDPRRTGVEEGRSINLALSVRGIHALKEVGLADDVLKDAVPMHGRMMHAEDGRLSYQPYGKDDSQCINSVSRAGLNIALLNAADGLPGVTTHFGSKCTAAELETGCIELQGENGARTVSTASVIGSDGAFSVIRGQMQRLDGFNYAQSYLSHGYKELCIPPAPGGGFQMHENALHIWPRGGYMMIALPNADGSFTCTLFWPLQGANSFDRLKTAEEVREYFGRHFPDAVPLMPTLQEDYFKNPTSSLVTVRCAPWSYRERFVLIGDAAHAVVPFYGQGMNASFEDCSVLSACLEEFSPDIAGAYAAYGCRRKVHTDVLADLAIGNFVEMRDHVSSTGFLLRKKTELFLYKLLRGRYLPLYTMVTFSRMPYAQALARVRRQSRVLQGAALAVVTVVTILLVVMMSG